MTEISEIEAARDGLRPFPDLPWICVDAVGDVAIFVSAGFGPIPSEIFASIEAVARALPVIESAIPCGSYYVYDYVDAGWYERRKAYQRIRVPFATVRNNEAMIRLPHARAPHVRFAECESVIVEDQFERINVLPVEQKKQAHPDI